MMRLAGRTALVTGGNGGIGRPLALALAAEGADLVIHHHGDGDGAASVSAEAQEMGRVARVLSADFTSPGMSQSLAERALAEHGPIDILLICAAVEQRRPWTEVDEAHIAQHVAANFASLFGLCRVLVPPMAARGWGRVVAIGSILASRPRAETVVYAALKSAQRTAIEALARDVASAGVTMNVISPGAIRTETNDARYRDGAFDAAVTAKIPTARPGTADDLVGPLLMLCSDEGRYITGGNLVVDGGWGIGDAPGTLPKTNA